MMAPRGFTDDLGAPIGLFIDIPETNTHLSNRKILIYQLHYFFLTTLLLFFNVLIFWEGLNYNQEFHYFF